MPDSLRDHRWPLDEDGLWPRILPDDPEDEPAMIFDWALQVVIAVLVVAVIAWATAVIWRLA